MDNLHGFNTFFFNKNGTHPDNKNVTDTFDAIMEMLLANKVDHIIDIENQEVILDPF